MPMPRPGSPALAVSLAVSLAVVLGSPLAAQGVQPLSGTWRVGSIGTYFQGPCPTPGPGIVADLGVLTFTPAGAMTLTFAVRDVCPGGTVVLNTENEAGTYAVGTDGVLTLDFDPSQPGTETAPLFLRADGSVAMHARADDDPETAHAVAVALSSGMSDASLQGAYHVARLVLRNDGSGLSSVSDLGTITFDGAGGYVDSGQRHAVSANGVVANTSYSAPGSYSLANDGSLTVAAATAAAGPNGAVSRDRELFFWVHAIGLEAGLTVGVRAGSGATAAHARGAWGMTGAEVTHGSSAGLPLLHTDFARIVLTPQTASAGSFAGSTIAFDTTSSSTTDVSGPLAGTFTIQPGGELALAVGASTALPARVSASGTYVVGRPLTDPVGGLLLGLLRCAFAQRYGSATAGSGGHLPSLESSGGFPHLGNGGFGLDVRGGLGGAAGAVVLAWAPSPGIPLLGGTLWFDPSAILIGLGVALSGAPGAPGAGAATLPLAIPANPALDGARMFQQALVLDPGAPAGIAMSQGLSIELCR